MWRADARSAQIGSPDFIGQRFQVSAYSGEPFTSSIACNLLSKHCWRLGVGDESPEVRPQMPRVICSPAGASGGEWLAGTGSGPTWFVGWPAGELQSDRPTGNSGEEMTLTVWLQFIGLDGFNAAIVDLAWWYQPGLHELFQSCTTVGADVVVEMHGFCTSSPHQLSDGLVTALEICRAIDRVETSVAWQADHPPAFLWSDLGCLRFGEALSHSALGACHPVWHQLNGAEFEHISLKHAHRAHHAPHELVRGHVQQRHHLLGADRWRRQMHAQVRPPPRAQGRHEASPANAGNLIRRNLVARDCAIIQEPFVVALHGQHLRSG
jgi:hypothetical protein